MERASVLLWLAIPFVVLAVKLSWIPLIRQVPVSLCHFLCRSDREYGNCLVYFKTTFRPSMMYNPGRAACVESFLPVMS